MRVAIMQPYLFPYIGYFQLMHAVDAFVLLDDVTFIKKGWINRNQLLVMGAAHLFTVPLVASSQNKYIKDLELHPDSRARHKLLATIRQEYSAAPEFECVFPLVEQVLFKVGPDLTHAVLTSLELINTYVGLPVPILRSSALTQPGQAVGQARIIALCQHLGAHEYLNMLGGQSLYSVAEFARQGIRLQFLQPTLTPYPQYSATFIPGLSIIDLLMHNNVLRTRELFQQTLIL